MTRGDALISELGQSFTLFSWEGCLTNAIVVDLDGASRAMESILARLLFGFGNARCPDERRTVYAMVRLRASQGKVASRC